jgi:acyl-CoA thioesterase-1
MKRFIIILFLFTFCHSNANSEDAVNELRIVVFGDSLTSGYKLDNQHSFVKTLERKFASKKAQGLVILNGAVDGQTTQKGLERVDKVIVHKPHIVILSLGSNDAFKKVSVEQIYKNLAGIISKLKKKNIKILLVGVKLPNSIGTEYQKKLPQMYEYLAQKYSVELYPDLLKDISTNPKMSLADGIHPNNDGMKTVVENIFPKLENVSLLHYRDLILQQRAELEKQNNILKAK